jgi:hypothetical protein
LSGNVDPTQQSTIAAYVGAFRAFLNDPNQLTGETAFSEAAIGNLSRPYFPDGQANTPNGPLSRPIALIDASRHTGPWSPFSDGLQTDLVVTDVVEGLAPSDAPHQCTFLKPYAPPNTPPPPRASTGPNRMQNGMQIFSGSVPVYRGNALVGAIGISGDGTDQDNLVAFLGLYNAGVRVSTIGEAPAGVRSDQIVVNVGGNATRLRYVNCPVAPFVDSSTQSVCDGK